ncbi:MAG: type IV pilus assembly protein PilM, partial [Mariprofundaceae bacterium]|nr:type IV pilus assembly protein PilM [Mariprofundaceae bacterium]
IDDVYLDFQILGEVAGDEMQMQVVLAACKREVIEDYQLVLNEAGLTAKCVDCAVFTLENAAELLTEQVEEDTVEPLAEPGEMRTHALVNIGANMININILQNGQMAFVRDQFYGGNNLTEEIQKTHSISFHAADQMKMDNFSGIKMEALEKFYLGLANELVRSLDFYAASHADHPVQKLLLSGGTALIPGIVTELEQRLGIETRVLNPFPAIKVSRRKFDPDYLNRIGPMMMVPIGLALRSFDA